MNGLVRREGKEYPVELDSSLTLYRDIGDLEKVENDLFFSIVNEVFYMLQGDPENILVYKYALGRN